MSDGSVSVSPYPPYLLVCMCMDYQLTSSNLMVRDDMANLGLGDVGTSHPVKYVPPEAATPSSTPSSTSAQPSASGSKAVNPTERI